MNTSQLIKLTTDFKDLNLYLIYFIKIEFVIWFYLWGLGDFHTYV